MAIFRNGVKVGKFESNWRTGLSKERGQGILRKIGILEDDKGRKKHEKDAKGEMQTIRTIVGRGEGFQHPVNFKVRFGMPKGIDQQVLEYGEAGGDWAGANTGKVKSGGLDWKTHIMNNSTQGEMKRRFDAAKQVSSTQYKPADTVMERSESKLDLYCSKVSIPERQIQTGLYRQAGAAPFPFPQTSVYGSITTSFYCDGTMHIKNYFDAWQKLIHNDLTGNFNFWDEYTAEFDIHTRTTIASGARVEKPKEPTTADKISQGIKDFTSAIDEATGVDGPRGKDQGAGTKPLPHIDFRENYGVRVFSCFPQIVGELSLDHSAADSILTFDVTWSYVKWNPFKIGNIGNRSTVNLSVGEFRNEKDGFPFLEDLPQELSGPMTEGLNQNILTSPLSKASNLFG
jgi:hypothetical protein